MRPPFGIGLAFLLAISAHPVWAQPTSKKTNPLWKRWLALYSPNQQPIHRLAVSRDGQYVAGGQVDGNIYIWNVDTGQVKKLSAKDTDCGLLLAMAFTKDDKGLLLGHKGGFVHWRFGTTRAVQRFSWKTSMVERIALSPNGRWLAVTEHYSGTIKFWDVAKGKQAAELTGHKSMVFGVRFSADSKQLASGDGNGEVRVWDVARKKEIAKLATKTPGFVLNMAFAKGGTRLFAVGLRDGVRLWDVPKKKLLRTYQARVFPFSTVMVSPDEKTVAAGSVNGAVVFWDVATGQLRHDFRTHLGFVRECVFSPNGKLLATNSGQMIKLFDDRRRVPVQTNKPSQQQLDMLLALATDYDEAKANKAILQLAATPKETLAFLKAKLQLTKIPDPKRALKLINDLDNRRFPIRSRATAELKTMGQVARKALRHRLKKPVTLEMKMRAERILEFLEAPYRRFQKRRLLLASIDILYRINNVEAYRLLKQMHRFVADDVVSPLAGEVLKSMPQRP